MTQADPFGNTADPEAYVPRTATEAVLVQLEMALRDGATVVSMNGATGAGKTLLLHVLAQRLDGDFHPIHVPYPNLSPDEFCHWGLAALNEPLADNPHAALASRIARDAAAGFPPLLLMVDDVGNLPLDTLRCLIRLQANAAGALRLVLVRHDDFPFNELASANLPVVDAKLEGQMCAAETADYVRERLAHSAVDSERRARLEGALEQLYALSGGNPGQLHAAAARLLCPKDVAPPRRRRRLRRFGLHI
jgi:type II secretory pathway predicted ATPase ExeA